MHQPARLLCLPYVAALVVVALLVTPEERRSLGLGPAPWGPWRLVAVHLAVAIPAGCWIATCLESRFRPGFLVALCLGTLFVIAISAGCGELLDQIILSTGVDFPVRCLWRCLLSTVAVLPLCASASGSQTRWIRKGFFFPLAACLFGLLPPGLFAWAIASSTLSEIRDAANQGRVTREIGLITRMGDLRGADWGGAVRPAMRLAVLHAEKKRLESLLKQTSGGFDKAVLLARLDRLDEALVAVGASASTDPEAMLLRSAILRAKGEWGAAADGYLAGIRTWERGIPRPETDWVWVEGAGQSLRMKGENRERELLYADALKWFPGRIGECHLEMGSAAAESGHSSRALRWWLQAESENPRLSSVVKSLRARLLSNTPTCLQGIFGPVADH